MRPVLSALLSICLIIIPSVALGGSIGNDLSIDQPYGWMIISDTLTLPVHLVNDGESAQLSVFRSEFSGSSVIRSDADLRISVQRVIDEVILTLPEARLLTSTGYDRTDRAGFILEFVSRDTTARVELRHRFEGVLFRLGNGNQVMYTLWAKVPKDLYAGAEEDFKAMQASFEFNGSKDASVFPPKYSPYMVTLVLVVLAAGILVFAYRRRTQSTPRYSRFSQDNPRPLPRISR